MRACWFACVLGAGGVCVVYIVWVCCLVDWGASELGYLGTAGCVPFPGCCMVSQCVPGRGRALIDLKHSNPEAAPVVCTCTRDALLLRRGFCVCAQSGQLGSLSSREGVAVVLRLPRHTRLFTALAIKSALLPAGD